MAEPNMHERELAVDGATDSTSQITKSYSFLKDKATGLFRCLLCAYKTYDRGSIRSHHAVHSDARPYACDLCPYEAKRSSDLRKHKIIKHKVKWIPRRSGRPSGVRTSTPQNTAPAPYQHTSPEETPIKTTRDQIQYSNSIALGNVESLNEAKELEHSGVVPPDSLQASNLEDANLALDCEQNISSSSKNTESACQQLASLASAFHSTQPPVVPPPDSTLTVRRWSYKGTPLYKDKISGLYKCIMCSYRTMHSSSMRTHYAVHSDARPYACDMCSYEAKRLQDLRKHKLLKHGRKMSGSYKMRARSSTEMDASFSKLMLPKDGSLSPQELESKSLTNMPNDVTGLESMDQNLANLSDFNESLGDDLSEENMNNEQIVFVKPEPPDDYYTHKANVEAYRKSAMGHSGNQSGEDGAREDLMEYAEDYSLFLTKQNVSGRSLLSHSMAIATTGRPHSVSSSRSTDDSSTSSTVQIASSSNSRSVSIETERSWTCEHCQILFFDGAVYFMHMGLHNPNDPWLCNLCGESLHDVYSFTSHFVNGHAHAR